MEDKIHLSLTRAEVTRIANRLLTGTTRTKKPEKVRPRDDMRNTIGKKESNFFGIRPCFLARHSEDSSITTPIDDMRIQRKTPMEGLPTLFQGIIFFNQ